MGGVASSPAKGADKHTQKDLKLVDGGAPNQVFQFQRWGISYGTDDKGHAAAIILSVLLVALFAATILVGAFSDRAWIADIFKL